MIENKLIAEFMGTSIGYGNDYYTNDKFPYNTSWDWLMPVLKKINIQLNPDNYNNWRMINRPTEYYLEDVYAQAVYFIQQLKQE